MARFSLTFPYLPTAQSTVTVISGRWETRIWHDPQFVRW